MLTLFTQRSLGKLPVRVPSGFILPREIPALPQVWAGSAAMEEVRAFQFADQTQESRVASGNVAIFAFLPSCPLFQALMTASSSLSSPHPIQTGSHSRHRQDFQCHSPKAVSNPEQIFCPIWLLIALKFMVTLLLRAQSPSLPSALPFGREFAFCPELKT